MLACLSTNPIEASCSSCPENLSSGGLFWPCPAIDTTICCISCANAFCCSCDVGAAEPEPAAGTDPETDEVVVVVEAAGVEVVEVVAAVVDVVVVEDAEDEEVEDGVGLKIRPGPTCGMPIVLQISFDLKIMNTLNVGCNLQIFFAMMIHDHES